MAQPLKLSIGVNIDAAGAKTGGAEAQQAVAAIGNEAQRTQTKLQQLVNATVGLNTGAANGNLREWSGALAMQGRSVDELRAKYNPLFAVIRSYKQQITEIRTLHAEGVLSSNEMVAAISRERQATLASIEAIKGRGAALRQAAANANSVSAQTRGVGGHNPAATNAMFQLQDIGMTAAMGMNPAMIALQQGSQLAGNFAGMGIGQVGATMAGAFTQLLSPVALATVAITGLTAAALQYFMKSDQETEKANRALEGHADLIRRLRDAYGDAIVGAREYATESKKILGQDTADAIKDYRKILESSAKDLLSGISVPASSFDGKTYIIGLAQSAIEQLKESVADGKPDVKAFVERLIEIENHPAVPDTIKKLAEELRKTAAEGIEAQAALSKLLDTQRSLENAASRAYGRTGSAFEADQRFRQLELQRARTLADAELNARSPSDKAALARLREENRTDIRESPDTRAMRIADAGTRALAQAEKELAEARRDRIRSMTEAVEGQQLELTLIGKTVNEAERLRMEHRLIAQAKAEAAKNGVAVDREELRLIAEKSRAYGQLAEQIAATNMIRDQQSQAHALQTELQLVGAGEVARRKALAALQAEQELKQRGIALESDLGRTYKRNAEILTEGTIALERHTDAWNRYRSAGESAIDTIVDGLGNLEKPTDILKSLAGDLGKFALETMVKNPLKNAIFGTNYGTFADLLSGKTGGDLASSIFGQGVGAMTVNAATVMINGAGGILGSLAAANDNAGQSLFGQEFKAAGITKTGVPLSEVATGNGLSANVASAYAPRFQGLLNDLKAAGYNVTSLGEGGYSWRNVSGTDNLSRHAFGEAIDINPRSNPWSERLQTDLPSNISDLARRNGLTWGGNWNKPDTMHFQVDKSISDAALALDKVSDSASGVTGSIGALGSGLGAAGNGLNQFGLNLGQFGQTLQSALAGGNNGLASLLGSFTSAGISAFNASPQFVSAVMSGGIGLWDRGGWTGSGGKYEPAGIVHRDEFVFSKEATRAIGVANLDAIHRAAVGGRGFAAGGYAGQSFPRSAAYWPSSANGNAPAAVTAAPALPSISVHVDNPRGDRDIEDAIDRGVARGIKQYRKHLGADIERVNRRPKVRGQLR